jgi:hypothetical protein
MPGTTYFGESEPATESEPSADATVTVTVVGRSGIVPAVTVTTTGGTVDATVNLTGSVVVGTGVVPAVTVLTYVPGAAGGGSHFGRRRRHSGR